MLENIEVLCHSSIRIDRNVIMYFDPYKIDRERNDADIILINTCGFIESAKQEAIDTIFEMAEYKKKKCKFLIVTRMFSSKIQKRVAKSSSRS